MNKYLGEQIVPIDQTPYKGYTKLDWIQHYLDSYMYIDGSHHKQWLLNEILKITYDTEIIIRLASWDNGEIEWRIRTGKESNNYLKYLSDGEICIEDIQGIAP